VLDKRFLALAGLLGVFVAGCGGGGGGASSVPTEPTPVVEEGTAKFNVDVLTGKVGVTSLASGKRAVLGGQAVAFETTSLLDESGEVGRRAFSVKLKNNLSETIGIGRPIRIHFGVIGAAGAYNSDLRANAEVTSPIPQSPPGSADGAAGIAELTEPNAVTVSPDGTIYFNGLDGRIRRLKEGYVSTVAVNVPCTGLLYMRDSITGREFLLAASPTLHSIKIITIASGSVGTWAGLDNSSGNVNGSPGSARFNTPSGLALDPYRGQILVADAGNGAVRAINFSFSNGGLVANSVAARYAGLSQPVAVAVSTTQSVGIVEFSANRVRVYHNGGSREALFGGTAGDVVGDGNLARFQNPNGIATIGESFFVSDTGNARVKRISLKPGAAPLLSTSWTVSYVAGSTFGYADGNGTAAQFGGVKGLAIDQNSRIVATDVDNNAIRRITSQSAFDFGSPDGSANGSPSLVNATGFSDLNLLRRPYIDINQQVAPGQTIDIGQWQFAIPGSVKAFSFVVSVETGTSVYAPLEGVVNPAGGPGSPFVEAKMLTAPGNALIGPIGNVGISQATGISMDAEGNLYLSDYGFQTIRRVSTSGQVTLVAGRLASSGAVDGSGSAARFTALSGIRVNAEGTEIFVLEDLGNRVRRISRSPFNDPTEADNWTVTTIAGLLGSGYANGTGDLAQFQSPFGLTAASDDELFFADFANHTIRSMRYLGGDRNLPQNWRFDAVAGTNTPGYVDAAGGGARFDNPISVAYSPERILYVLDRDNVRVRSINLDTGQVSTVAGSGTGGFNDHATNPLAAQFGAFTGIAVDASGAVYIQDINRIRKLYNNSVTTVAGGGPGSGSSGDKLAFGTSFSLLAVNPQGDLLGGLNLSGSGYRLMRFTRKLGR